MLLSWKNDILDTYIILFENEKGGGLNISNDHSPCDAHDFFETKKLYFSINKFKPMKKFVFLAYNIYHLYIYIYYTL